MRISQLTLSKIGPTTADFSELMALKPQWVIALGSAEALQAGAGALATAFPEASRMGCSTAGEISGAGVTDGTLVVTAMAFDKAHIKQASTVLSGMDDSFDAGRRLALELPLEGLRAIVILGQGVKINGSAVLSGLVDVVGPQIPITGGLAGDGGAFVETWVLDNQGVSNDRIVCMGLYGQDLVFSHGSFGGWSPFGPARQVTRCDNNVLYELDGEPALDVYKRYLGEHAKDLPASGLLFPFAMLGKDHNELGIIRTILGIDEKNGSLTLAGDIVPDGYLKLMHASTDALVSGAETAAHASRGNTSPDQAGLALLVSCVGRKLVMGGRVDEEVEVVADLYGSNTTFAGFYSYGEISPHAGLMSCKLHNQTMTISYISETL
ncbi:MAG: hypothetical protein RL392_991 [Pseudomonadota bacterium]|jgi:hypothetical protein